MVTLGLFLLLGVLVLLGQPLFVIIGSITTYCYWFFESSSPFAVVEDIYYAADKEILLAVPLFILAGTIMTEGGIAQRLIRLAAALTAPIPSGLAIAGVLSCAVFAAISGSSPVTLIAVGSILYPALVKEGYSEDFASGLLTAGGTLGIIIPPSIPMIIFGVMTGVSVIDLFLAGVGPGLLLTGLLIALALFRSGRPVAGKWNGKEVLRTFKSGIFSVFMPLLIIGGIYSGHFSATESAAVAVFYAFLVEAFIHRELKLRSIPKIFVHSAELLGSLFLILVFAVSLNKFLTYQQVPQMMVESLSQQFSTSLEFLIGVNLFLLLAGCFMDVISAILILAPLLVPVATHYGIHPVHFGIIMIVNLEIGYLTPPLGINLFVASTIFKQSLGATIRAAIPTILVLLLGLGLITFLPDISLFLVKR